jgi:hypothetical protein
MDRSSKLQFLADEEDAFILQQEIDHLKSKPSKTVNDRRALANLCLQAKRFSNFSQNKLLTFMPNQNKSSTQSLNK